jgi:transcriptional regulator with XRE-family HTH domain
MLAAMTTQEFEAHSFGAALKRYRGARRMSQLDLANVCEVSARHVSFLESGRARPSRDMVLQLGAGLLLPLGARNVLLHAAGFAPSYPASPLGSEALGPFRAILDEMLARHAPNPAIVIDRHWNVREANAPAQMLLAALHDGSNEMNVVRMIAGGGRAAQAIANLPEVLNETNSRLQLEALEAGGDPIFAELLALLARAMERHPQPDARVRRPVMPLVLNTPLGQMSFLSAIAHFGTSEDVTIRDLRVELFFPANDDTREIIKRLG